MSLMIIAKNKNIKPWLNALKNAGLHDIEVYPNIKNKNKITAALMWSKNSIDFTKFKNLKLISSMGAGVDHIVCNKTINKDIYITKIVDKKLVSSMYEYLLTVVMNVLTNHYRYIAQQRQKNWRVLEEVKSVNKTIIGVLGLGQLGKEVAINFSKMGFKVKAFAKSEKNIKGVKSYTDLDFVKTVDIVINLLPLTNETEKILDYDFFKNCKKSCYIINVGRGKHLVVDDLLKAIEKKHISGATLDVFETEPLEKNSALWNHEKIVITPHSASLTDPNSVLTQIIKNYKRVKNRKKPNNIIDRKKFY